MGNISAKFTLNLPLYFGYLCAKGSPQTVINLNTDIKDFKVSVELHSDKLLSIKNPDEDERRFIYNKAIIHLTGSDIISLDDDMLSGTLRYLLMKYQLIVIEALNRIYRYFKYCLRNPLIEEIDIFSFLDDEEQFYNPQWLDSEGKPIEIPNHKVESGIILRRGAGFLNDKFLGIQLYDDSQKDDLEVAFDNPIEVPLYEELLSNAQDAAIQGNNRRAVLELAITTEVYVKNVFFGRDLISSAVFDFLEDKRRTNVKVLDLIDSCAKYALNCSFKEDMPNDYENIDYLFRCRNKIVHRGELGYRDNNGSWHECLREQIQNWWDSVINLINWLNSKLDK